jgi:hypothetical protein
MTTRGSFRAIQRFSSETMRETHCSGETKTMEKLSISLRATKFTSLQDYLVVSAKVMAKSISL